MNLGFFTLGRRGFFFPPIPTPERLPSSSLTHITWEKLKVCGGGSTSVTRGGERVLEGEGRRGIGCGWVRVTE